MIDTYYGIEIRHSNVLDYVYPDKPVALPATQEKYSTRKIMYVNSVTLYKLYFLNAELAGGFDDSVKRCLEHARQKLHKRIDAIRK